MAVICLALSARAQQGEILYTVYQPDWCLESIQYARPDSIKLDFDADGQTDFVIEMYYQREIDITGIPLNGWEYRSKLEDDALLPQISGPLYDTLVSSAPIGWVGYPDSGVATDTYGVRKVVNDSTVYYGWLNVILIDSCLSGLQTGGQPYFKKYICVHDVAFCTEPNYPLRWGQTVMESPDEKDYCAHIIIRPNPTSGHFAINGNDLKQAEVFNMLGHRVATAQGTGSSIQIDLTGQAAGVYYVSVTDTKGRKCVRKVVKE